MSILPVHSEKPFPIQMDLESKARTVRCIPFSCFPLWNSKGKVVNSYELTAHSFNLFEERALLECLGSWNDVAQYKRENSGRREEKEAFKTSKWVVNRIEKHVRALSLHAQDLFSSEIFICRSNDSNRTIQGVALVLLDKGNNSLRIKAITTNPGNISSRINRKEHSQLRGAGSVIIAQIFKRCIEQERTAVQLFSVPSAIRFYKNRGFNKVYRMDNGLVLMSISYKEVKFLEEHPSPIHPRRFLFKF